MTRSCCTGSPRSPSTSSLSRSKVYELVRAGVLPSVRIDRVRRVRGADVIAFVESLRNVA